MHFTADDVESLVFGPLLDGDVDRIMGWIEAHVLGPADGMALIVTVALMLGKIMPGRVIDPLTSDGDMYAIQFGENSTTAGRLVGQIVTAALNEDTATVSALAHAAASHEDEAVSAQVMVFMLQVMRQTMVSMTRHDGR